jgi:hypothetical protein
MDILTSNQLELMGIFPDKSAKLIFQGKEFVRGSSFAIKNKKNGVDFCLEEEKQGHHCLLIEDSNSVTVWKCVGTKNSDLLKSTAERKDLLNRCRLALTKCIGPMAELIMDELADDLQSMSQTQMVDAIAEQIPDSKLANGFRENMKNQ